MSRKKLKVFIDEAKKTINIDGKTYFHKKTKGKILDGKLHGDKVIFEEIDEKEVENDINFIIENIFDAVDKRKLLKEIMRYMDIDTIKKTVKQIKNGARIKTTKGCYGITIGQGKGSTYIDLAG